MARSGSIVAAVVCAAAVIAPGRARANFPPIARANVDPEEALVGEPFSFRGDASVDPDAGPAPLTYLWDFGDGVTSDLPNPSHTYDRPGLHPVTLTVSDGAASRLAVLEVAVLRPVLPERPASAAPLALDAASATLYVASPDSNSVSVVATDELRVIAEVPVGADPRTVALSPSGELLFVACREAGELWAIDTGSHEIRARTTVGRLPFGAVALPDGRLVVTSQGSDEVFFLDARGVAVEARLDVADGPRAVAVSADGTRAWVTHFLTRGDAATVTVIDTAAPAVAGVVTLAVDPSPDTPSSGGGYPNLLSALAVHPTGERVWVGGLKANTGRGLASSGEPLVPTNRLRGLFAQIDVASGVEDLPRRIDTNDADSVSAIAFSPNGRYAYVTHQGAGTLSVYDLLRAEGIDSTDGASVSFETRLEVGHAPQAALLSPDGSRLYVSNYLSRAVSVLDLTDPARPVAVADVTVTEEPLDARVANGKRLFYRSAAPRHSRDNYTACASCHPEGGMDGRTWDLTQSGEGLRNTIDLRGRAGMGHGPVHWSANFDEIQDFENAIVGDFGGTGLADDGEPPHPPLDARPNAGRSTDLDDLAAFVSSLADGAESPYRTRDGWLGEAARRGKIVFESAEVGCTGCHSAPRFTDSVLADDPADYVLHDVGTLGEDSGGRLGAPLVGLDTPSLIGLWDTAPYLHDGSAASLRDVITTRNLDDRHGRTSSLSDGELDDLVAYILSIDGRPDEPPIPMPDAGVSDAGLSPGDAGPAADASPPPPGPPGDGCACSMVSAPPSPAAVLVLAAILAASLRRRAQARAVTIG